MEITIKNPTEADDGRLVSFYERLYRPGYILTDKRFRTWWLRGNPFWKGEGYSCKVAELDGEYVGHIAYVPVPLWSFVKSYRGAWGGNFIVDERFRRMGIGQKLHEAVYTEVDAFLDV